jgi:hypothetical protein
MRTKYNKYILSESVLLHINYIFRGMAWLEKAAWLGALD